MTTTTTPTARSLLNTLVVAEIRAEMGRQGKVNADIARALGVSEAWTTRRLSHKSADTVINLADLERIASVLGVPALKIMAAAAGEHALKQPYGDLVSSATSRRPKGRAHRQAVRTPAPVSHGRRDSTRPVSAVPANRRRPAVVGMGKRPIAGQ